MPERGPAAMRDLPWPVSMATAAGIGLAAGLFTFGRLSAGGSYPADVRTGR